MKKLLLLLLFFCGTIQTFAQCFVTISSPQNATCGQCNGVVEITFSGGVPPYAVNFNGTPTGSTSGAPLLIPNVCPGSYSISVTDGNSVLCTGMLNVTVGNVGNPVMVNYGITNPSCPNCADGIIQAQAFGGSPPYTYLWSTGAVTSNLVGLTVGTYTVIVTDANGCMELDTIVLGNTLPNLPAISGRVYVDANNDSIYSTGDIPLGQQQVRSLPSGTIAYTTSNGEYFFPDTPGTYTIEYVTNPVYSISNGINSHAVTLGGTSVSGYDFALQPDSFFNSLDVYAYSPLPRCNLVSAFYIAVTNNGTLPDSGTVAFNFDPQMIYSSSWPVGTVTGNMLLFTFDSLLPGQTQTFVGNFMMPGPGAWLYTTTTGTVFSPTGMVLATDTQTYNRAVLCAFDPNDKQVMPEGDGTIHRVPMDTELRYLIRFQNTGNDTAFNVVVTDTLDAGLDENTAYVIATSHPCWIQKINGNVMQFSFDNILLPDSNVNEPESHGYVLFKIKGKNSNPDPTEVYNSANIYFDFNPPVITNSTMTTFSNSTVGIQEFQLAAGGNILISPHPLQQQSLLYFDGIAEERYSLTITDISGRKVSETKYFSGNSYLLQREGMQKGMYLLQIRSEESNNVYQSRLMVD